MKKLHIGIVGLTLVSIAGCSSMGLGSKRVDYKAGAVAAPSLEIPPEMTTPAGDDRFKIPGETGGVATYSNYNKNGANQTAAAATPNVLPEVKGVHLEKNGTQRWLVINDKAENVWGTVKAFWQESGLAIKTEDQAIGVMETDWVENRAKIPQEGLRSVIGKVFDGLYASGERDQYRTRLERSKDGTSTEIYVTHRGMEEVLAADKNTSKWQARANDPELEAIMLQRLMLRLGGTPEQVAAIASDTIKSSAATGEAKLQEIYDGSQIIVISDAFDKSWRRVGLAIEQSGFTIEDKDRAKGIYLLRHAKVEQGWLDKLKFWKDAPNENARYRVTVKDSGVACEVATTDQDGAKTEDSKALLASIFKHINQ
jgi:outer membrane protein assembly factor BamC